MSNTIKPPKTVLDFKRIEKSILGLMGNPYCDEFMFRSLSDKLDKCQLKIKELQKERTLLSRVEEEKSSNYTTSKDAAIDHLKMSHAHLFEETEGIDIDNLLSDINKIIQKLKKYSW